MKWLRKEATLENLNSMIDFVLKNAENDVQLSKKKAMEIRLICEELLINIISYSYPKEKGDIIAIYEFNDNCITLSLCDYGIKFNPVEEHIEPDLSRDIMDIDVGGLGILIVKKVSDYINYKRINNMNILTVKKYCS